MATKTDTSAQRLSQSPWPVTFLSGIFLASAFIPPGPYKGLPPFVHRFGFASIFAGAGYVLSTGDSRNGSGVSTAWSLIYLFLNARKSLAAPRHPIAVGLTLATIGSASLYGSEYFFLSNDEEDSLSADV
ncbi:hypothetical protein BJ322DRAFT_858482 [Thelephora terrestris]|uniref:Uncharacterized protein n=1 Tax=Thelephora terrestris TaxID=56493 RepID=A0A9P6HDV4_9AGAM|nr:hypothetical protein BJ322DRAFT_858482 [Thelephora terrestris]